MTIIQEYDLSGLKPLYETKDYVIYKLGYITEEIAKGIRVNKKTQEQTDIQIKLTPKPHIIAVLDKKRSH
jgi:hypothetical protein